LARIDHLSGVLSSASKDDIVMPRALPAQPRRYDALHLLHILTPTWLPYPFIAQSFVAPFIQELQRMPHHYNVASRTVVPNLQT
jgi:hypothetical protein